MTVGAGFVQAVWTFGGTVPGPVIRVKVGDTIRIHLKNPATSQLAHSVDFHASQVAWNDEMTSINPGEEKVYEWRADYAGVWMYHCGTSPALHHIANGMYGMVIVEPAEGLAGIEVYYPTHNAEQVRNFLETAKRMDLVVTGGSDYHGPGSGHERLGEIEVPERALEDLLERRRRLFG